MRVSMEKPADTTRPEKHTSPHAHFMVNILVISCISNIFSRVPLLRKILFHFPYSRILLFARFI